MAAVKKTFDIALDIADAGANREFTVVDGDSGTCLPYSSQTGATR